MAEGSGPFPVADEQEEVELAEEALKVGDWTAARERWHRLACALPRNRHYRTQLTYARAGEFLAAGDQTRAREELERVLRAEPDHAGAQALMRSTRKSGWGRLFGR